MDDRLTGRRRELASLQSELMALSARLTELEQTNRLKQASCALTEAGHELVMKNDAGEMREARMASYVAVGLAKMRLGGL
jgi:hypothetical protein